MKDLYESRLIRLVAILVVAVPLTLLVGFVILSRIAVYAPSGDFRPLVPFAIGWVILVAGLAWMWFKQRNG